MLMENIFYVLVMVPKLLLGQMLVLLLLLLGVLVPVPVIVAASFVGILLSL